MANVDTNSEAQQNLVIDITGKCLNNENQQPNNSPLVKKTPSIRIEKLDQKSNATKSKCNNSVQDGVTQQKQKCSVNAASSATEKSSATVSQNVKSPAKRNNVSNCDILAYMEDFKSAILNQTISINNKLDMKINDLQNNLSEKFNALSSTVDDRINAISDNINAQLEAAVDKKIKPITKALESRVDKLDRESLMLELNVSGVPLHPNERIHELVDSICMATGFKDRLSGLSSFYRLPHKASKSKAQS